MGSPAHHNSQSFTTTEADESDHDASSTATEPLPRGTQAQPCDCFAHLRPANLEAFLAFDEVASEIKNSPDAYPYHRDFIAIETIVPLSSLLQQPNQQPGQGTGAGSQEITASATQTETDEEGAKQDPRLVWTGHYAFSFDARLELPPLGWRVGGGRWKKSSSNRRAPTPTDAEANTPTLPQPQRANAGVDILLAKSRLPSANLYGLHARFAFDRTGAFVLAVENPRRPPVVLGDEAFDAGQRVLARPRSRVAFGSLAYEFEFTTRLPLPSSSSSSSSAAATGVGEREAAFQARLAAFLRETFVGKEVPPPELLASPAEADFPLHDWLIRGTVGRGAFGTVTAARHRVTGRIAAAKMVVRNARNVRGVMAEVEVMGGLPEHPSISALVDVIYERGERWYAGPRPERVWLVSTPFVRDTCHALTQPSSSSSAPPLPPMHTRLALFHQILAGLACLHAHGFLHRDVKPANLGIVSLDPAAPRAVILDFGHTVHVGLRNGGSSGSGDLSDLGPTNLVPPRPGAVGTVPYLAPEMEHTPYGAGVDMWALGVVGYQLFVQRGLPWRRVPEEEGVWRVRREMLVEEAAEGSVEELLCRMLEWDAEDRVGARGALGWACFDGVRGMAEGGRDGGGRGAERHEDVGPVKRARTEAMRGAR